MEYKVSLFKSVKDVSNVFNKDVLYCLSRIKKGSSKDLIEKIRKQTEKSERNKLKNQLPGVCFNGTFSHRSEKGLIERSGLIILDFDNFEDFDEAVCFRDSITSDPYIFSAWISPSGNGVKALVKIDLKVDHKKYFDALKLHFDIENFDLANCDVSRFCFESYDPNIYLNKNSKVWTKSEEVEIEELGSNTVLIPVVSTNKIINNLLTWFDKKYNPTQRNVSLFKLASALNDFGINQNEALNTLLKYEQKDFKESEIKTICNSAYKKVENHGTKFFEDVEKKEAIQTQLRIGKNVIDLNKKFAEIPKASLEQVVEQLQEENVITDFWTYSKNGSIKLDPLAYKFWLEQNNFSKYYPTESGTYTFIKKEQNLIEETTDKRIKDYVLNYILNRTDIGRAPYNFLAKSQGVFSSDFLSLLDSTDIHFKEDTAKECFIYYKNCVVEVTKDEIKEIDYIDIDGFVWKRQIIDREFKVYDHHKSEFRRFLWLIAGEDVQKYNSFKSVVGYLLHSFKTSANNKAIIFNDETISENPNGGSGKGLFWNALAQMKKVSSIDGKTFEFTKSFPYQTVNTDTQILVFDDVKKNFSFESLFSLITEGITLEYKNQDAIKLPVTRSPKILITTNYTIGGVGGSFERRKFEVEFSGHFNANHTPIDEFGKMLFDDWDATEWLKFDNFMLNCLQYYLQNGLKQHDFNNLETRKFIKNTSHEFFEWSKERENLKHNERLSKKELFEQFINEYQDLKKWLSQKRFKQWLEQYCRFYSYEYTEGNTQGLRWCLITNNNINQEDAFEDEEPF